MSDFDPLAPETFTSFHEEFAELRRRCPVAHSEAYNGFWALTRYEDVVAAVRDPATFTTTVQNVVPKLAFTGRRPPLHLDPPEHTPYRAALNPYFTAEKMRASSPGCAAIIGGLLEPLVGAGEVDICEAYTYRLPGYVFAEFFNLSPELGLRIRDASREFNVAVQDFVDEEVKRTSLQLYDIAREIIAMRKAEPLDPADDPDGGPARDRAPRGHAARDDPAVHRRRDDRAERVHRRDGDPPRGARRRAAAAARRPVAHPCRGRRVPSPADAVPRLRADADPRRRRSAGG